MSEDKVLARIRQTHTEREAREALNHPAVRVLKAENADLRARLAASERRAEQAERALRYLPDVVRDIAREYQPDDVVYAQAWGLGLATQLDGQVVEVLGALRGAAPAPERP